MTLADIFTLVGNLCTIAAPLVPSPGDKIFQFAAAAAKAGAAWATAGEDPVVAITRHLDLDKIEADREAHWASELQKRKFIEVPAAKEDPGSDPYEGQG